MSAFLLLKVTASVSRILIHSMFSMDECQACVECWRHGTKSAPFLSSRSSRSGVGKSKEDLQKYVNIARESTEMATVLWQQREGLTLLGEDHMWDLQRRRSTGIPVGACTCHAEGKEKQFQGTSFRGWEQLVSSGKCG